MADDTGPRGESLGAPGKLKAHRLRSLTVIALGLALLAYMVTVEDEPGALPLALILVGTVWYFVTRRRMRATRG